MGPIATLDNLMIATLWQNILKGAGIACEIRNHYAAGGVGDLPTNEVSPQIWLSDERDVERARALLAELRSPSPAPPWFCPGCGERLDAQFFACWSCGTTRA
jgi:hypothetical protein